MKKRKDFFNLRYPPSVAKACCFLKENNGEFFDFPFILPYECKNLKYEKADVIVFEKIKYLKLTEVSRITIKLPLREKRFCWGVINISSEKKITFLIWINLNSDSKDITNWFLGKDEFSLIRDETNESFTVLWSA